MVLVFPPAIMEHHRPSWKLLSVLIETMRLINILWMLRFGRESDHPRCHHDMNMMRQQQKYLDHENDDVLQLKIMITLIMVLSGTESKACSEAWSAYTSISRGLQEADKLMR